MYALIALAVAFVVYTAFLLQCFKPTPPPPVQHPKQSWWDPASIHMHECRLASFLLLLLWNWKLLKNINDIIYTTTKACLRVERGDREGGRREQMKKFNKNYTTHTHTHHTLSYTHTDRQTDTSHLKECNELSSCKSSKLDDKYVMKWLYNDINEKRCPKYCARGENKRKRVPGDKTLQILHKQLL